MHKCHSFVKIAILLRKTNNARDIVKKMLFKIVLVIELIMRKIEHDFY